MIRELIIGAVILTPIAHGQGTADPSEEPSAVAQVETTKKPPPKPEDFYQPWDSWLKKQGSPISGRDVWDAQQATKIKGEVLICITGAETNFGKVAQRGSNTNVGSVGSYDATRDTHHAPTVKDGLMMIGQTLNNQLLGNKTTIAQLSRASEPYGHVYASSTHNWRVNVLNCLTEITGKPQNDQFEFRLK